VRPAQIVIIAIAFIAAIGFAVVIRGVMIGKQPKGVPAAVAQAAVPQVPMVRVLVAKRDLAIGARVTPEDVTWQEMPQANLNPNFITDGQGPVVPSATTAGKAEQLGARAVQTVVNGNPAAMENILNSVVHAAIAAGEPILAKKLIRGGEGGYLSAMLSPGMRAIAVPVTAENSAGGFILPGDHVDVIQVSEQEQKNGGKPINVSQTIVTNVRVLAIDQKTQPDKDAQAIVGAAVTLEVTPDAADALLEGMAAGKLQLALRSYSDASAPSGVIARAGPGNTIRLYENGKVTEGETNRRCPAASPASASCLRPSVRWPSSRLRPRS